MDDIKKLLNWSEISRQLVRGDRNGIRPNKIPKKHLQKINNLLDRLTDWQKWCQTQ